LTVAETKDYVARKRFDALDARLANDLQRHFERGDARSEVIHRDLDVFSKNDDAGDAIRTWRRERPNSAFAYAAEASFLTGEAWRARGSESSDKVSSKQFDQMQRLAGLAIEAAETAVRIEPKLLPSWRNLIELGQLDNQPDVSRWAFESAVAVDPGCYHVNRAWMLSLRPGWGGSYEAMDAFATKLAKQAKDRPLLALLAVLPDWDRAIDARDENDFVQMARLLKPHLMQLPSPEAFELLGPPFSDRVVDGQWEGIAYLLEGVRFGDCGACTQDPLGDNLTHIAGDAAWGMIHLKRQVIDNADDLTARFLIGQSHYEQAQFHQAIADLQLVLARATGKRLRHDSLSLLIASYKGVGDSANVQRYTDQLTRESEHSDR